MTRQISLMGPQPNRIIELSSIVSTMRDGDPENIGATIVALRRLLFCRVVPQNEFWTTLSPVEGW